jgi:hypothetical protein
MLELHPSWDLLCARKPVPDFARQAARGDAGEAPHGALAADAPDLAPDDSALRAHVPGVEMALPPPPPSPSRTKWTRHVPHPILIGHAASLTPY